MVDLFNHPRLRAQLGTIDSAQLKQLGVIDTLLNQLIERLLLDQEVARLQLDVSDEVVRNAIYDNPAFRGPDGRFDRAQFNQMLMMNRLSEEQLVARLRREIPRSDLLQAVTVGVAAPRPVVDTLYRYRNEKRVADIVAFPVAAVADPGPPAEADLTAFYEGHPDLFRAPEYRGFTAIGLAADDLAKEIDIAEDKVKKEYEERKEEFTTPEQRQVEQILSPSEDKAKEVEAALAAGKPWREAATEIAGQDPETIELGLLKRQELPGQLADIAFELPLGEPSQPTRSPLGWHILRVVKITPPSGQGYDEVKGKLTAELAREEALNRLDRLASKVDDALAGGAAMADVAAKFGLKAVTIAATDPGGRDPDAKQIALPFAPNDVLKTAFEIGANDNSRVIAGQDSIYAVRVEKIVPSQVRPLAEVKDRAVAAWQAERKRETAANEAKALVEAVKPDAPLAALAAERKLALTTSPPLARRPEAGTTVPAALVAKLFAAKPGETVTAEDANGAYAAQLKEVQGAGTPDAGLASALSNELSGAIKLDVAGQFTQALRNRFPVDILRDAVDKMF